MSSLLLVDASNLYFCVNKRYADRRVDYKKLFEYVSQTAFSSDVHAIAYVGQSEDNAQGFCNYLRDCGYVVKTKRPIKRKFRDNVFFETNWGVEMSIDLLQAYYTNDLTSIWLASSNPSIAPLTHALPINILACGIPKFFGGHHVEIDESLLLS